MNTPWLRQFLDYRLVVMSGSAITPGSLLVGLGVVLVAIAGSAFAGRSARMLLRRRGLSQGAQFAASKIIRYATVALGMLIAVNSMGIRLDALFAASAVLAVGIGFGLQNIAQNFVSGLILLVEQPVRKGDFVRTGDTLGVIDDIGLRATRIITRDEVAIIVPNSLLITESVINHSRPTTRLRIRVAVGVAYGSPLAKVCSALKAAAAAVHGVLKDPEPEVRFESFDDSSLAFALLVWIDDPRDDLRIASSLRFAITASLQSASIEIPFPQREVHVRSLPRAT